MGACCEGCATGRGCGGHSHAPASVGAFEWPWEVDQRKQRERQERRVQQRAELERRTQRAEADARRAREELARSRAVTIDRPAVRPGAAPALKLPTSAFLQTLRRAPRFLPAGIFPVPPPPEAAAEISPEVVDLLELLAAADAGDADALEALAALEAEAPEYLADLLSRAEKETSSTSSSVGWSVNVHPGAPDAIPTGATIVGAGLFGDLPPEVRAVDDVVSAVWNVARPFVPYGSEIDKLHQARRGLMYGADRSSTSSPSSPSSPAVREAQAVVRRAAKGDKGAAAQLAGLKAAAAAGDPSARRRWALARAAMVSDDARIERLYRAAGGR